VTGVPQFGQTIRFKIGRPPATIAKKTSTNQSETYKVASMTGSAAASMQSQAHMYFL
jgi:hypothetical protein